MFTRPHFNQRLQDAVAGLLATYGLGLANVVQARGWYDESQVG